MHTAATVRVRVRRRVLSRTLLITCSSDGLSQGGCFSSRDGESQLWLKPLTLSCCGNAPAEPRAKARAAPQICPLRVRRNSCDTLALLALLTVASASAACTSADIRITRTRTPPRTRIEPSTETPRRHPTTTNTTTTHTIRPPRHTTVNTNAVARARHDGNMSNSNARGNTNAAQHAHANRGTRTSVSVVSGTISAPNSRLPFLFGGRL